MNQYTPKDTVGKGYGNLAASISSTKKSSTSSILMILTPREALHCWTILSLPCLLWLGGCESEQTCQAS